MAPYFTMIHNQVRRLTGMAARRAVLAALVALTLMGGISPVANAQLAAVGPVDPATGFPIWYQDSTGTRLQLCLSVADPLCAGTVVLPNPALPVSMPANFPDESFYYMASADIAAGPVTGFWEGAIEATFLNGVPVAGDQMVFARIRIRISGLTPGASYTVTHPYGQSTFVANTLGRINDTVDVGAIPAGLLPTAFNLAMGGPIGPFLKSTNAPAGALGDGVSLTTVTGSPTGNNLFRITGPNAGGPGVNTAQTSFFTVMGKLVVPGAAPLVAPASATAPGSASVSFSAVTSPTAGDWIGLYAAGAADTAFIPGAWNYVSGTKTPTVGLAAGTVSVPIPAGLAPGTYEFRMMANGGFTRLSVSAPVTVTAGAVVPPAAASLTPATTLLSIGRTGSVSFSGNANSTPSDWIGLYRVGAADTAFVPGAWNYINGTRTPTVALASGTISVPVPAGMAPGTYEYRLMANNGFTRKAASVPVTVQ